MKFRMPRPAIKNPGPWRAEQHPRSDVWYVVDANGVEVCAIFYRGEDIAKHIAANGPGEGEFVAGPVPMLAIPERAAVPVVERPSIDRLPAAPKKLEAPKKRWLGMRFAHEG